MLFLVLKFVHILAAILAVGFNAAYGLIIGRARRGGLDGREMAFALKTVKVMDDRVANPCYLLLGITGVSTVIVQGYAWSYTWIHTSLALLVGIDRFMSECRALTNLIGNGVATVVISRWENEVTRETLVANLNSPPKYKA